MLGDLNRTGQGFHLQMPFVVSTDQVQGMAFAHSDFLKTTKLFSSFLFYFLNGRPVQSEIDGEF